MTVSTEGLTCRELVQLVTDYFEDVLDLHERVRFESHLEMCAGCTAFVSQMRVTIATAGTLDPISIPPEAQVALMGAFRDWKQERAR